MSPESIGEVTVRIKPDWSQWDREMQQKTRRPGVGGIGRGGGGFLRTAAAVGIGTGLGVSGFSESIRAALNAGARMGRRAGRGDVPRSLLETLTGRGIGGGRRGEIGIMEARPHGMEQRLISEMSARGMIAAGGSESGHLGFLGGVGSQMRLRPGMGGRLSRLTNWRRDVLSGALSFRGGRITRGLSALGEQVGRIPVVGGMATRAAGMIGGGAATTGVLALGAAALLAAKQAAKMTNAQIKLTEEFVKARKTYRIGAAYGMGLQPTSLGGIQTALAATKGRIGQNLIARQIEEKRLEREERWRRTGKGIMGTTVVSELGAGPKTLWEGIKSGWRSFKGALGGVALWGTGISPKVIEEETEAQRKQSFRESVEARRKRKLLERMFPMLQHEYARGTAIEGMAAPAGAVAIATPSNPFHRELIAKIDEAIDSINRLGKLP